MRLRSQASQGASKLDEIRSKRFAWIIEIQVSQHFKDVRQCGEVIMCEHLQSTLLEISKIGLKKKVNKRNSLLPRVCWKAVKYCIEGAAYGQRGKEESTSFPSPYPVISATQP
eukprot:763096-Hanusia_phi.AAC.3